MDLADIESSMLRVKFGIERLATGVWPPQNWDERKSGAYSVSFRKLMFYQRIDVIRAPCDIHRGSFPSCA